MEVVGKLDLFCKPVHFPGVEFEERLRKALAMSSLAFFICRPNMLLYLLGHYGNGRDGTSANCNASPGASRTPSASVHSLSTFVLGRVQVSSSVLTLQRFRIF